MLKGYDAITRRAVIKNNDTRSGGSQIEKVLERAMSFTIDFETTSNPFYLVQLSGR